ncbi:MAG: cell wall hydrolase [Oscillospiraceae bacterium]|nr:cell wall hydrolase [Oscillospiraceae bacterium]
MHADIERSFRLPLKLLTAFAAAVMLMLVLTVRADAAVSNKLTVSVADWKETGVAIKRPAGGARFAKPEKKANTSYSEDDLWCLAAVIYQEAGGDNCSDLCRKLVGSVVLNRAEDTRFFGKCNTIREVLQSPGQYNMEDGVSWADRGSSETELAAIDRAFDAAKAVLDGDRPCPKNVFFQSEFSSLGDGTYCKTDGYYFNFKE